MRQVLCSIARGLAVSLVVAGTLLLPGSLQAQNSLTVEASRVAIPADVASGGKLQLGSLTSGSASCIAVNTDRPYADLDCDGTKETGEEYLDGAGGGGGGVGWSPILDIKTTSDTPDDEFSASTLDGQWTAVSGSSGTAALLEASNVSRYDLTSREGWLLAQAGVNGSQSVKLRQDYTLPDGSSIVAALSPAFNGDGSVTNNEYWVGISVNNNDSSYDAGTWTGLLLDLNASSSYRVILYNGSTAPEAWVLTTGERIYLRIARSGLNYHGFLSFDGATWSPLGKFTIGSASDNLWIFADNKASHASPVSIQAFDWIRLGTNNVDPW